MKINVNSQQFVSLSLVANWFKRMLFCSIEISTGIDLKLQHKSIGWHINYCVNLCVNVFIELYVLLHKIIKLILTEMKVMEFFCILYYFVFIHFFTPILQFHVTSFPCISFNLFLYFWNREKWSNKGNELKKSIWRK